MRGLGTIINVIAIVVGCAIGMILKGGLKERFREVLLQSCGLATMFIGISGALKMIFTIEDGKLVTGSTMMIIVSLAIGGLVGELINIEKRLDFIGEKLKILFRAKGDNRFVDGFVTTSLVCCVGAMSICGPLEEGLTGNSQTLFVKSILDLITVVIFTSVYGFGSGLSAITVGVYQGTITLCAVLLEPFMDERLITNLSGVGSVLIFALGFNLLFPKKIRVGNFLPALLIPIVYELILLLPWF